MRNFSILLLFLSLSWHRFQSFSSSISPICSHQSVNTMVTFPLNATASLPPPEKFSFTTLDCSASRFQHILISDCLLPTWKEKPSHTQISVPPTSVPLISVFKDSFLHYQHPNLNITDVIFQCVCCVCYCIAFSIRRLQ